ncbi:helix-turn-helix domain-containing protein [Flammeovirga sp. SubArs3]|uniref:helix-turn-helix domain-containing protein n=1 Tax=Flammeovirga sp. SubArs3 TaxID=2995316 RepID=UPI00248B251A|nr:helix-turn-helix domain-containing protein [Flammeovirga sp. SubArs3]
MQIEKRCQYCNKKFIAQKVTTRYCSHSCNQKHYKQKKKDEKVQKVKEDTKAVDLVYIQQKELLTPTEAKQLLGIGKTYMYKLLSEGKIRSIRITPRSIRIPKTEIENYLLEQLNKEKSKVQPPPTTLSNNMNFYWSISEIEKIYEISSKALYDLLKRNNIRKLQKGAKVYVKKSDIKKIFDL